MKKLRVAVLMGGRSPEYEISLKTGQEVLKHLDRRKYLIFSIIIPRDGRGGFLQILEKKRVDVVFIAMHGPFGEDGTAQGMLELLGIPYTGSGVLTSSLGMNKIMSRKIFEKEKIPVPKYLVFRKGEKIKKIWDFFVKPPIFVKPYNQGSSVGGSVVRQKDKLTKALKLAFSFSDPILIEEYLEGIEVSCGLLGNENPQALPVAEIVPKNEFFDYEAKYTPGKAEEIVPARIPKNLTQKVKKTAIRVFKAIGACGFARVDMIIKKRTPVVLEINTIPGLTSVSILPKEAASAGISYSALLDRIIKLALE